MIGSFDTKVLVFAPICVYLHTTAVWFNLWWRFFWFSVLLPLAIVLISTRLSICLD